MFCPECGSMLIPKKNTERKKSPAKAPKKKGAKKKPEEKKEAPKKILVCSSCNYTSDSQDDSGVVLTEKVEHKEEIVAVVDQEVSTLPIIDATCPECSHEKAFFWTVQTRAADEPETKFMRCEKCKHTWRDYD